MGKKTRKTRWRTLAINSGDHSDSEESNTHSGHHQISKSYQQRPFYSKFPYSSQSTPIRSRFQNDAKSTRSSSTTSETKITFNEDEYTRITTPRQDVLFKKGYLSKPKIYQTQTSTGNSTVSTGNSTGNGTPDHQSADGTEGTDLECEPQFVFPNGFVDQNGIYYVNSYEPYPPFVVYNAPYCYSEYPPTRSKRYSTDSLAESTSPHNEETSQDQSQSSGETANLPEANPVFSVIYPTACYYTNGISASAEMENTDTEPRKVKKRRRRKLSKPIPDGTSSDEYESDEVVSEIENRIIQGTHRPNTTDSPIDESIRTAANDEHHEEEINTLKNEEAAAINDDHHDQSHLENEDCSGDSGHGESPVEGVTNEVDVKKEDKVTLKADAKEFVPRTYHPEHILEFVNMSPNFIPIPMELPPNFSPAFLPPGIPINFIPPDKLGFVNFVPNYTPKPYEAQDASNENEEPILKEEKVVVDDEVSAATTDVKSPLYPKSNIDIAKIVSKLEEAAKEQRFYENRKQKYSPHKFNKNFNKPRFEKSYSEHKMQKRNGGFTRKQEIRRNSTDGDKITKPLEICAVSADPSMEIDTKDTTTKDVGRIFGGASVVVADEKQLRIGSGEDVRKVLTIKKESVQNDSPIVEKKDVVQKQTPNRITGPSNAIQIRRRSPEVSKKVEVREQKYNNDEGTSNISLLSSTISEATQSTSKREVAPTVPEAHRPKISPTREPESAKPKTKFVAQRRPVNIVHKPSETCSSERPHYAATVQKNIRTPRHENTLKTTAELKKREVVKPEIAKPGPNQWIPVSRKKRNKNRTAEDEFQIDDVPHQKTEDDFESYDINLLEDVVVSPAVHNTPITETEKVDVISKVAEVVELDVISDLTRVESKEHDELDLLIESLKEMEFKSVVLKKKATPKQKRVMITDVDLTEIPEKKVVNTPSKIAKKLDIVKKKEEVLEVKVEEESPEKKRCPKKKKKPVKTKSLSNSSSNTTLNNLDDTYDFLLNESLLEDEKTNVEVSEELDKIIQRGMYSSLEEKIKSLNITAANDGFFKTISFSSKIEKPSILKPNSLNTVLSSTSTFQPQRGSVEESTSLTLENKVNAEITTSGSFLDVTNVQKDLGAKEEKLYPITQAVKEWMTKTRETTPDVEILKSPSTIFKEQTTDSDEEVTIFSANDWSLTPQTSFEDDLLECWDDGSIPKPEDNIKVDVGEDVLEMYDCKYGSNDDYVRIKAEIEEKKRNGTFPKHANLPYRAICCSLM